ncbi:ChbG/HpnK family deacetylase [bacterium]|nr:ChbG/HpnK family deacetylase [bacterium]
MNICADDYGLAPQVNAAILNLIQMKKICSVSVLIKECSSYDAIRLKNCPELKIGLHLDLFKESPIGNYLKYIFNQQALNAEIKEQLRLFKFKFGFFPNYIDGHMHCQIYPIIRKSLIGIIATQKIPENFYIRSCLIPTTIRSTKKLSDYLYLNLLAYFNVGFTKLLQVNKINTNSHLYGAFNGHLGIETIFESFKFQGSQQDIFFFHPSTESIHHTNSTGGIARKHEYEYISKN